MRFEELVAVWATQADKPLFSINEFGIHMALYQQRERARRRLFWGVYFPFYVGSLLTLGMLLLVWVAFYFKDTSERDFPMASSDWAVFCVAAALLGFAVWSMWQSRTRHETAQNVLAPSLRQEIERGIAQVEFEVHSGTSAHAWRNSVLIMVGSVLFCWEAGRLNGNAAPWTTIWIVSAWCVVTLLATWFWARRSKVPRMARKRALEALLGKLDESDQSSSGVPKSTLTGS